MQSIISDAFIPYHGTEASDIVLRLNSNGNSKSRIWRLLIFVGFSPIPYFRGLSLGSGTAEQQTSQGFSVKRKQGPEVTVAAEGGSGGYGKQNQCQSDHEAGQPEEPCGRNQQNAVKPDTVAEFRTRYGKGGKQSDRRVEQYFYGSPVQAHGNVAYEQSPDNGEGAGQSAGVQRGGILQQVQ